MVIHSEDGITKELLCEWLGRYGGGIDRINTFIDMTFGVSTIFLGQKSE